MESNNKFKFNFYEWERKLKDKPFLRQPFGDKWEEYTWGETGQMARKLATGLKTLGLPPKSHIGLMSKNCREYGYFLRVANHNLHGFINYIKSF